jgi:hypothetical protein
VRRRIDRLVVARAALMLALGASGCRVHDARGAGDTVRSFYAAAAQGDMGQVRAALAGGSRLHGLERRFGALESWATRATKNGTIARVEVLDVATDGDLARVRVVVLFNDGTRRHDRVALVRAGNRWLLDPGSLPGARAFPGRREVRRSAAMKVSSAGQAG